MPKKSKLKRNLSIVVLAIVFFFAGYLVGHKNLIFEKNYTPQIINTNLDKPANVNFGLFWETWNKVMANYVGSSSAQDMVYGAIKGMVSSLGDPYSQFMDPTDTKAFNEDLSGQIQGIGAEISQKDNQIVIVAPIAGSPAEKAGLKAGDQIMAIDDHVTTNMSLDDAITKIRGAAGTKVKLLINRSGFSQPQEFTITRDVITIKSVQWEMKGNIGYIQISQFDTDTSDLIKQATAELAAKNPKGIVLDLRDDPGGYLNAAIDVSSLFMNRGVVVQEKSKDGHVEQLKTTLNSVFANTKVVVLINGGSASASEIVAGALRDARGAELVGENSFGKGSVQEIDNLPDGSALKITVAKWLTPDGSTIDKVGLKPDVEIGLTAQDTAAGKDPQLDRALQDAAK
ncbi:MAG: S41 family peptidase [Patescibacteria group bacterium]